MNKIECESCIKRKTIYCPNSEKCFATKDKPFYQNRIMLLEENQELKNQQKEFIEWLESEKDRLAKECSHTYEDSLGRMLYVNEDIYNEVNKILSKYKGIIGVKDE